MWNTPWTWKKDLLGQVCLRGEHQSYCLEKKDGGANKNYQGFLKVALDGITRRRRVWTSGCHTRKGFQ
ncbi:hypothetical protein A2U01_0061215, partial [Trifolium medium]|nr:hypothetical protein [Trifolium medium]